MSADMTKFKNKQAKMGVQHQMSSGPQPSTSASSTGYNHILKGSNAFHSAKTGLLVENGMKAEGNGY